MTGFLLWRSFSKFHNSFSKIEKACACDSVKDEGRMAIWILGLGEWNIIEIKRKKGAGKLCSQTALLWHQKKKSGTYVTRGLISECNVAKWPVRRLITTLAFVHKLLCNTTSCLPFLLISFLHASLNQHHPGAIQYRVSETQKTMHSKLTDRPTSLLRWWRFNQVEVSKLIFVNVLTLATPKVKRIMMIKSQGWKGSHLSLVPWMVLEACSPLFHRLQAG